jgi:hypothetical protein
MAIELDALAKNQTWTLVSITEADNIVGCKWVFKLNVGLMVLWRVAKHVWLLKDTPKRRALIIQIRLASLLNH